MASWWPQSENCWTTWRGASADASIRGFRGGPHPPGPDQGLSGGACRSILALSLYPELLDLRPGGARNPWGTARRLARRSAAGALSPLGWPWMGSRPGTESGLNVRHPRSTPRDPLFDLAILWWFDHLVHDRDHDRLGAADVQEHPVDVGDASTAARGQEASESVQGRPPEAQRRDDEILPGEQDISFGWMSSDAHPASGVLHPLRSALQAHLAGSVRNGSRTFGGLFRERGESLYGKWELRQRRILRSGVSQALLAALPGSHPHPGHGFPRNRPVPERDELLQPRSCSRIALYHHGSDRHRAHLSAATTDSKSSAEQE